MTVEVKGCTRMYHILDLYETEFDSEKRLIADKLCVVYLLPETQPRLAIIPRDAIPPEYVLQKAGWRISGRFKNERTIGKFLVE